MNTTYDLRMVRGRTLKLRMTARDELGQAIDLTGAKVYLAVTADQKIAPSLKLSSDAALSPAWRTGIVIAAPQTGSTKGQFTVTFIPADTAALVALGDDDPWLYDCWVVLADTTSQPVITTSKLALYPQVTTTP